MNTSKLSPEQIDAALNEALELHSVWLKSDGKSGVRFSLAGKNLRGADMRGIDLCQADLSDSTLHSIILRRAMLKYADLEEADISGANLRKTVAMGVKELDKSIGLRQRFSQIQRESEDKDKRSR